MLAPWHGINQKKMVEAASLTTLLRNVMYPEVTGSQLQPLAPRPAAELESSHKEMNMVSECVQRTVMVFQNLFILRR